MKSSIAIVILLLVVFLPASDFDCFTIIVGKDASIDGSVIIAHNEDDRGKPAFVDIHRIPARFHSPQSFLTLKNGSQTAQTRKTFGFLWLQLPGYEFGDGYFNENGVVLASNSCKSREDQGKLTGGGIGFMLRRLIAQRALSARQAVRLAGQLIETYGYYSSGRTLAIADAREGWLLHLIRGKRWIAQRVPDDEVAVISNYYTIASVDLNDTENFMGSPDIIEYAIKRNWTNPEQEESFDFARAYSDPKNLIAQSNILRQWRATNMLARDKYPLDARFPFSFKPRRKIRVTDCFRVLRDHYEGTEYDATDNYRNGSPNSSRYRTICTHSTQYAFVAQLRRHLPREISSLIWLCLKRPDSNAFSPWYIHITAPPGGYTRRSSDRALATHFSKPESFFKPSPEFAFCRFARLSELVDAQYRERIKTARKTWNNFENFAMKNIQKKEKEFEFVYKKNRIIALNIMTSYVHDLEYRKWFFADELIREFENH
jgi:dipeptidase